MFYCRFWFFLIFSTLILSVLGLKLTKSKMLCQRGGILVFITYVATYPYKLPLELLIFQLFWAKKVSSNMTPNHVISLSNMIYCTFSCHIIWKHAVYQFYFVILYEKAYYIWYSWLFLSPIEHLRQAYNYFLVWQLFTCEPDLLYEAKFP